MITAAEIFGALNRLAVATIIRDFQTGPSGFGATTDAGQASQPGAATPAQGEILAPVAPSPNPSESPAPELVLMKPAPAAGETLLGMRAPLPPTHANDAPSPASAQRGAPMSPYFGAGSRAVPPPSAQLQTILFAIESCSGVWRFWWRSSPRSSCPCAPRSRR